MHSNAPSYNFARDHNQWWVNGNSTHTTMNIFSCHGPHDHWMAGGRAAPRWDAKGTSCASTWISRMLAGLCRNALASSRTPSATASGNISVTSLSSLQAAPQTLPSTTTPSRLQVYIDLMFATARGYPCFHPQPRHTRPIRLGDVGTMGTEGFKFAFNVYDPPAELSEYCKSPSVPNIPPATPVFQEGDILGEGFASADTICSAERNVLGYRFHCPGPKGALLVVTSGSADLEELDDNTALCDYLRDNAARIYRYVRSLRHLEPGESLYVVTGAIKASGWALAAHKDPMSFDNNHVILENNLPPDKAGSAPGESAAASGPVKWRWTRTGNAETRQNVSRDEDGRLVKDQCLFLRGFLMTPSPKFQARLNGHWSGNPVPESSSSSDPSDQGSYLDGARRQSDGKTKKGMKYKLPWKGKERIKGGRTKTTSFGSKKAGNFSMEPYPPQATVDASTYPLQSLNADLLKNTHADFAISHDYCWMNAMKDSAPDADALRKAVPQVVVFANSTEATLSDLAPTTIACGTAGTRQTISTRAASIYPRFGANSSPSFLDSSRWQQALSSSSTKNAGAASPLMPYTASTSTLSLSSTPSFSDAVGMSLVTIIRLAAAHKGSRSPLKLSRRSIKLRRMRGAPVTSEPPTPTLSSTTQRPRAYGPYSLWPVYNRVRPRQLRGGSTWKPNILTRTLMAGARAASLVFCPRIILR